MKIEITKNQIVLNMETSDIDKLVDDYDDVETVKCVFCGEINSKTKWKYRRLKDENGKELWSCTCPKCERSVLT